MVTPNSSQNRRNELRTRGRKIIPDKWKVFFALILLYLLVGAAFLPGLELPAERVTLFGVELTPLHVKWIIAGYVIFGGLGIIFLTPQYLTKKSRDVGTASNSSDLGSTIEVCHADLFQQLMEYGTFRRESEHHDDRMKQLVDGLGTQIWGDYRIGQHMLDRACAAICDSSPSEMASSEYDSGTGTDVSTRTASTRPVTRSETEPDSDGFDTEADGSSFDDILQTDRSRNEFSTVVVPWEHECPRKECNRVSYMRYFYKATRQQIPIAENLDRLEEESRRQEKRREPQPPSEEGGVPAVDGGETPATSGEGRYSVLATEDDWSRVQTIAERIRTQIDELSNPKRREKIRSVLGVPVGDGGDPPAVKVDEAARLLHEEYIRNYESLKVLREMVSKLSYLLIVVLVFGLVFSALLAVFFPPFGHSPTETVSPSELSVRDLSFPVLFILVVFFGFFGSVVSNLLSFYNLSADIGPRMPDDPFQVSDEVVHARILLGGAAAAALYMLVLAGIFPGLSETNPLHLTFYILAFSFLAGFSDQLLVKALSVAEDNILQ